MLTIWKYEIPPHVCSFPRPLPIESKILCVQSQYNKPYMWVLFNLKDKNILENRMFRIIGTGHEFESAGKYIGTFQLNEGQFVGHLFEV